MAGVEWRQIAGTGAFGERRWRTRGWSSVGGDRRELRLFGGTRPPSPNLSPTGERDSQRLAPPPWAASERDRGDAGPSPSHGPSRLHLSRRTAPPSPNLSPTGERDFRRQAARGSGLPQGARDSGGLAPWGSGLAKGERDSGCSHCGGRVFPRGRGILGAADGAIMPRFAPTLPHHRLPVTSLQPGSFQGNGSRAGYLSCIASAKRVANSGTVESST